MHEWSFPIPLMVFLTLVVFFYVRGWLRVQKVFPQLITVANLTAFSCGIIAIFVALGSPLGVMDHELLSVHMVQHLLLMAVAAPFVLLGSPILAFLHGLPKRFVQGGLDPFLRSAPLRHVGRIIGHPAFCWFASTLTVIGWHLPSIFALGQHSSVWHQIQHASFLLAGFLFWWPVIRPWPSASHSASWFVPLYLFFATLPCDALSAFLTFCDRVVYPDYLSATPMFPISALQDQEWAGVLMWVSVTFIYMVPAVVLTVRLLSPTGFAPQKTVALRLSPNEISSLQRREGR